MLQEHRRSQFFSEKQKRFPIKTLKFSYELVILYARLICFVHFNFSFLRWVEQTQSWFQHRGNCLQLMRILIEKWSEYEICVVWSWYSQTSKKRLIQPKQADHNRIKRITSIKLQQVALGHYTTNGRRSRNIKWELNSVKRSRPSLQYKEI